MKNKDLLLGVQNLFHIEISYFINEDKCREDYANIEVGTQSTVIYK